MKQPKTKGFRISQKEMESQEAEREKVDPAWIEYLRTHEMSEKAIEHIAKIILSLHQRRESYRQLRLSGWTRGKKKQETSCSDRNE